MFTVFRHIIFLYFLLLMVGSKTVYAGTRDFINHSGRDVEISVNGLECADYPPKFTHCKIEKKNTVIVILKKGESVHLNFNHFLLGKINVKDRNNSNFSDKKVLVDKNAKPIATPLNYCFSIILKSTHSGKFYYEFNGCMVK